MSEGPSSEQKHPGLFRNYVSFFGAAIVAASLASIILLFLIELTSGTDNPYLGIVTYVMLPGALITGLLTIFVGMYFERRRRRRLAPGEIPAYPSLDLNDPRRRRTFLTFLAVTFIFIFMSAFGSYRAYEFSESVTFCGQTCHVPMKPEFTAYQASPHARVRCVECHVGGGAEWYVRAKLNGVHQLYGVLTGRYDRPIPTPVHNLRPANDTCAQCHWPQKFYGDEMRVFNHYDYDEHNTARQTRLLVHVGGGSPANGPVSGIHWHMNLGNEIEYIATDEHRQNIPWVRVKDGQGKVTEYTEDGAALTPSLAKAEKRRMDCIDCHNRPAHIYVPPDEAVNDSLAAGKLDASLPYLKRQAVEALSKPYQTNDEAVRSIAASLDQFYRANYADVYASKPDAIRSAVAEVQRIYQTYFFPEMKTDWQAHPNNIGHYYSQGCFRCHDGKHESRDGKVIRSDCNVCHATLDQSENGATTSAQNGAFRHPVELGKLSELNCTVCHSGSKPFQHPVSLGDISQFKCSDCHSGKVWSKAVAANQGIGR
jgi:nitrate/TMAO reductase-like tetraheme cytochrome c subunit